MSPTLDLDGPNSPCDAAAARAPRWLFKVVDVVSGSTIVEGASVHATVRTLACVESIFDVWIFVWAPELTTWRQLTPGEHRMLWNLRSR